MVWGQPHKPAIDPLVDAMAKVVAKAHDLDVLIERRAPMTEIAPAIQAMRAELDGVRDLMATAPA